jgi:hypothetical protein
VGDVSFFAEEEEGKEVDIKDVLVGIYLQKKRQR